MFSWPAKGKMRESELFLQGFFKKACADLCLVLCCLCFGGPTKQALSAFVLPCCLAVKRAFVEYRFVRSFQGERGRKHVSAEACLISLEHMSTSVVSVEVASVEVLRVTCDSTVVPEESAVKNTEKFPKNFASSVDEGCVLGDAGFEKTSQAHGPPEPLLVRVAASGPIVERTPHEAIPGQIAPGQIAPETESIKSDSRHRTNEAPKQVAIGGRDGTVLSCLRVPGVAGYLIAC